MMPSAFSAQLSTKHDAVYPRRQKHSPERCATIFYGLSNSRHIHGAGTHGLVHVREAGEVVIEIKFALKTVLVKLANVVILSIFAPHVAFLHKPHALVQTQGTVF